MPVTSSFKALLLCVYSPVTAMISDGGTVCYLDVQQMQPFRWSGALLAALGRNRIKVRSRETRSSRSCLANGHAFQRRL